MAVMSGKRALLEQLEADGFRYLFGNPGTTEQAFMDLMQDYPRLEFILCLHEAVAVSMADTYARATRKPSFVELHIGPGLGNGIGMLHNAYTGRSPLASRRKIRLSRRDRSAATSARVIIRPDPVGHSTVKPSPKE